MNYEREVKIQLVVESSQVSWEMSLSLRRNSLQVSGIGGFQVKDKSKGKLQAKCRWLVQRWGVITPSWS